MPTLEQLRDHIQTSLREPDVTDAEIDSFINEALLAVAERVLLPDLDVEAEVVTDTTTSVELPANYHRGLYACRVEGQTKDPTILTARRQLTDRFPNMLDDLDSGDITHVCVADGRLHYYPIPPEPVDVRISYYRKPTPLVQDSDVPTCIPEGMQRRLITSWVLGEEFDITEVDTDGRKVNAGYGERKFDRAIEVLDTHFKAGRSWPAPPRDRKQFV